MILRTTIFIVGLASTLAAASAAPLRAGARPGSAAGGQPVSFEKHVMPLLEHYCYNCHGNGKKKGGLALDAYKDAALQ